MGKRNSKEEENPGPADPEAEEKKRLRALAFSRRLLRRTPANPSTTLEPSKSVVKLDGRDVVKRGQRKSRYLFSFPGLLAPLSGGRVGELADLGTRNPVLYLEFPQGRMKLLGTHIYPKNKYLTLQLTKSSKGVMCEDSFDSMIVFSDAWWIGRKEENPEELQLEFPKDFNESKHAECDFKGGAGATFEEASGCKKPGKEYVEPLSPDVNLKDDMLEESNPTTKQDTHNVMEATPVRQSARTSGKILSYAESSGEDSIASDAEVPEMSDEKVNIRGDTTTRRAIFGKTEDSSPATSSLVASENELVETKIHSKEKIKQSSLSSKKSKDNPSMKGPLVQATLSSLFDKVVEKKSKRSASHSPGPKGSSVKRQRLSSEQITGQVQVKGSNKKAAQSNGKKDGTGTKTLQKKSQIEDSVPEEISSESQDGSDEDWAA